MLPLLFALVGLVVGIVINRAADNLPPPARRSLFATPHCPYCDASRAPIEQFGTLAFVLRRDRCHQCGSPLTLRYPVVEITTAALFAYLSSRFPPDLYLVLLCFFSAVLFLITVIDIEHKLILNIITFPATLLAVASGPVLLGNAGSMYVAGVPVSPWALSLLGAAAGYIVTYLIYLLGILFVNLLNRRRTKKINTVAFGMGDVKLAGLLGALVGVPLIFSVLIYAILLGGVGALAVIVLTLLRRRGYAAFTAIPYGPYLILAGMAFMIFGLNPP